MSTATTLPLSTDTLNKFHELTTQFNTVAAQYIAVQPLTVAPYGNTDNAEFIQLLINGILTTMDKVTAELPPLTSAAIEAIRRSFIQAGLPVEAASAVDTLPGVEPWLNGERWGYGMKLTFDPESQSDNPYTAPYTVVDVAGNGIYLPHALNPHLAEDDMRDFIATIIRGLSEQDKNELKAHSDAVKKIIADHYAGEGVKLVRPEARRSTMRQRLLNIEEVTIDDIRKAVADQQRYAQEIQKRRDTLRAVSAELMCVTFDLRVLYHSVASELGVEGIEFTEFMRHTSSEAFADSWRLADGKYSGDAREVLQMIVESFPTADEHLDVLRKKVAGEDDVKALEWLLLKPRRTPPSEERNVSPDSEVKAIEQSIRWFNL